MQESGNQAQFLPIAARWNCCRGKRCGKRQKRRIPPQLPHTPPPCTFTSVHYIAPQFRRHPPSFPRAIHADLLITRTSDFRLPSENRYFQPNPQKFFFGLSRYPATSCDPISQNPNQFARTSLDLTEILVTMRGCAVTIPTVETDTSNNFCRMLDGVVAGV